MKALRGDLSSEFVDPYVAGIGDVTIFASQPGDCGFDNVLTDAAVQFGTPPFHFYVHDSVKRTVYFFHHYWKLSTDDMARNTIIQTEGEGYIYIYRERGSRLDTIMGGVEWMFDRQ